MERREAQWGFLFISPWIIGLAVFYAFPIVASLLLTFFDASLTGAERHFTFIGLDNWIRFFNDPMAWKALGVTVRFTLLTLPVGIFVPLAVALVLNSKALVAPGLFRVLWFLPYVIPFVAGIIGWLGVIGQNGPLNTLIELFGVQDAPLWTNDPGLIYPALVLMGIWGIGSAIVVYLSGLGGVPTELYEAAMVDGCTRAQAFRRVIVPVMWPGIITTGLFSFLLAYNDFLLSSALTNAGNMTMPAAIASAIGAESEALLMQGVAGAVSITLPLVVLVVFFQRQIVAGLTQGAVKG